MAVVLVVVVINVVVVVWVVVVTNAFLFCLCSLKESRQSLISSLVKVVAFAISQVSFRNGSRTSLFCSSGHTDQL